MLGRAGDPAVRSLLEGHGYAVHFVSGDDPMQVHRALATALDTCAEAIAAIQRAARTTTVQGVPRWPLIVLRTPKGWTGPRTVNGLAVEGTFRSHQVPLTAVRTDPVQLAALDEWLRSYRPAQLFDTDGRLLPALAALAPAPERCMGQNPWSNGGRGVPALRVPEIAPYAVAVPQHGHVSHESTRPLGAMLRDTYVQNPTTFRLFCPDETNSNRLGSVFDVETRCVQDAPVAGDDHVSAAGRVMEVLSEHTLQGWLEGYLLTGRHGVFATYEAFALIVASMATQHAKWLDMCAAIPWRSSVPSLNYLLTSTCWRNDHNGFSHQGPGFMDTVLSKKGTVVRVYLPPDANCLLAVADHCLRSVNAINLIIIDKQPQLQWLGLDAARAHCAGGASIWPWACQHPAEAPDVVLACAGDTATLETLAAAAWLRRHAPELCVRVVNVVDLMTLFSPREHPHGMTDAAFTDLFTFDCHVVFSFHGYAGAVHQLLHSRPEPERFHVRGYKEEGTTTTPFDMVVLNETSRFHIAMDALRRSRRPPAAAATLTAACRAELDRHQAHILAHLDDLPEIAGWKWPDA